MTGTVIFNPANNTREIAIPMAMHHIAMPSMLPAQQSEGNPPQYVDSTTNQDALEDMNKTNIATKPNMYL